jgi:hypothetical protein
MAECGRDWKRARHQARDRTHTRTARMLCFQTNSGLTDSAKQATPRREPTFSRRAARSATRSRPAAATRSAPRSTACLAARRAPSRATPTPTPTRARASHGTRTHSSSTSRTPRSTSPAPRWPLAVSRRTRTGTTSSRTFFPATPQGLLLSLMLTLILHSYLKEATA